MADARLSVIFAGPFVSIQDRGRPGLMRFGVPVSGPMDRPSAAIANAALGNPPDAPLIEISMGGLTLVCEDGPVTLAVAGGGFIVEAAGEKLGSWTILTLREGDRLVIRPGPWGTWTYLAFAGRLDSQIWMGSAATHSISGKGGGKLKNGQSLTIAGARVIKGGPRPIACPVWARPKHIVQAVAGPQDRHFLPEAMASLSRDTFYLTNAYDRMGMRLDGPKLLLEGALSIPSEPILRGSVQVTGAGVATVLMADHQTTGGYPKIATMVDCDTDAFAQLRPRQPMQFSLVSPDTAITHARLMRRKVADHLASLRV